MHICIVQTLHFRHNSPLLQVKPWSQSASLSRFLIVWILRSLISQRSRFNLMYSAGGDAIDNHVITMCVAGVYYLKGEGVSSWDVAGSCTGSGEIGTGSTGGMQWLCSISPNENMNLTYLRNKQKTVRSSAKATIIFIQTEWGLPFSEHRVLPFFTPIHSGVCRDDVYSLFAHVFKRTASYLSLGLKILYSIHSSRFLCT